MKLMEMRRWPLCGRDLGCAYLFNFCDRVIGSILILFNVQRASQEIDASSRGGAYRHPLERWQQRGENVCEKGEYSVDKPL